MNDVEYMLSQDNRQKKSAGRAVFNRKGGSRSKYCSLPSDNLTAAERRKLNGAMEQVNLNDKMSWKQFKKLSHSLQREYITHLREKYGARNVDIAEMMGIERTYLSKYLSLNFNGMASTMRGTKKADPRWVEFIGGESREKVIEEAKEIATSKSDNYSASEAGRFASKMPDIDEYAAKKEINLAVLDGSVRFKGDAGAIFTKAMLLFDSAKEYEVIISFKEVADA